MGEDHQRRVCSVGGARRVLHRYCGTSSEWRPPEPLSDHVPSFQGHISSEIVSLLEKGAIEEVDDHPCLCLSPVFVIPKRSGSLRMILNMKRINLHLGKVHFRMDHLVSGRLAFGRKVGGSAVGSCADSDQHDSRSRISHKLGEIGVRPDSHAVLPRCSAGHSSSAGSSQSRQGRDDSQDGSFSEMCTSGESRALASVARVSLQSSRHSSRLSTIDETLPTLSVGVLSAEREFSFDVDPPVVQNQGSSRSLASSFLPPSV